MKFVLKCLKMDGVSHSASCLRAMSLCHLTAPQERYTVTPKISAWKDKSRLFLTLSPLGSGLSFWRVSGETRGSGMILAELLSFFIISEQFGDQWSMSILNVQSPLSWARRQTATRSVWNSGMREPQHREPALTPKTEHEWKGFVISVMIYAPKPYKTELVFYRKGHRSGMSKQTPFKKSSVLTFGGRSTQNIQAYVLH